MENTPAHGLEDAIIKLGQMAEKRMETAETHEECAFLFGNLNLAAALAAALSSNKPEIHISLDYKTAWKSYYSAKKQAEEFKKEYHQISMEELFPKLFKALKSVFEEESTEKPTKPKKPTKKE